MAKKKKIELEYLINTSPKILYYRLSDSSGLEEWFADTVEVRQNKYYTFKWAQSQQEAELIDKKINQFVRFRWLDGDEDSYFELRIIKLEMSGDTALEITDFAEEDEVEDVRDMWDEQIANLKAKLGA